MAQNFHIAAAVSKLPDPQKTNLWTVEIDPPIGINKIHKGVFSGKLKFRANSISIPDRQVEVETSKYLGHTLHFPLPSDGGKKTIDINFVEREDNFVSIALNSWIHEIYDHSVLDNDKYNKYDDFKNSFVTEIRINLFGLDGEPLPTYVSLHNAFISSLDGVQLSYGKSDAVEYRATFTFDYWHIMGASGATMDAELMDLLELE